MCRGRRGGGEKWDASGRRGSNEVVEGTVVEEGRAKTVAGKEGATALGRGRGRGSCGGRGEERAIGVEIRSGDSCDSCVRKLT